MLDILAENEPVSNLNVVGFKEQITLYSVEKTYHFMELKI